MAPLTPTQATIPFHRPYLGGKEVDYVAEAVAAGALDADGVYTRRCARLLEERLGCGRALPTTSCTTALEIAAMLCRFEPGDEVILPSFTFVSTANAFLRAGARPVFVDVRSDTLNLDESLLEAAITPRTRAIVPVHYAGVGCEMDPILDLAKRRGLIVIEDAAQGLDAFYRGRALGSIGHLAAFSFHVTKNCVAGEGGALCVNDPELVERAEIVRDKGTNRARFLRGEIDKYTWTDVGCSGAPSELLSAFLLAQLERLDEIGRLRRGVVERYRLGLAPLHDAGRLTLPTVPDHCLSNAHLFHVLTTDESTRNALIAFLKARGVHATFHYVPLHSSPMGRSLGWRAGDLPRTEDVAARLIRLPCYPDLAEDQQDRVVRQVFEFFGERRPDRPTDAPRISL